MLFAICLQPFIPMRASASERSEMVNQMLFGDTFRIIEELPRWYKVIRDCDQYEGWIDWKTATLLKEQDYRHYLSQSENALLLRQPYNVISELGKGGQSVSLYLSWGSRIFDMDEVGIEFQVQGHRFDVPPMSCVEPMKASSVSRNACAKFLLQQARMLVNVPYLWGGCSAFGLDCSGFTQTLFRFIGISLPRNASQQAELGEEVDFSHCLAGDLAFFGREGKISHVGLCDNENRILHCSSRLHYDTLREDGIFSEERQEKTHDLVCIRRFF